MWGNLKGHKIMTACKSNGCVRAATQNYMYTLKKKKNYKYIYRVRRVVGGVFNLAVWRIIYNPPNLNNAVSGLWLLHLLTATAFRQIKVTPTTFFDRFAKYLTRQLFCVYGV